MPDTQEAFNSECINLITFSPALAYKICEGRDCSILLITVSSVCGHIVSPHLYPLNECISEQTNGEYHHPKNKLIFKSHEFVFTSAFLK